MRFLSRFLGLLPLALHVTYLALTFAGLPPRVGVGPASPGTPRGAFLLEWLVIVVAANLAFVALSFLLPRLDDRRFRVPAKEHWLAAPERRAELVDRIRGLIDSVLLGQNVFFLAVYQAVYQSNAVKPALHLSLGLLASFFMALPLAVVAAMVWITLRSLKVDAGRDLR